MSMMTVNSDADKGKIIENVIGSIGRASSGFNLTKQVIENALDAGATRIDILIDKKKKLFRVIDNGTGFTDEDIRSFYSFMVSGKDGLNTIGKNGSGRLALLSMCEYIVVHTRTEGGEAKTFRLGREHLINAFEGEQNVPFEASEEDIGSHGTIVELGGRINWKKAKTEEALMKRLPLLLMPNVLRKIWINGKPIASRSILEQPIEGEEELKGLGKCSYELHIVPGTTEGIWLCGKQNKIMALREAIDQLPSELREVIPPLITDDNLTGIIQIDNLNRFRGHDDTLIPEFYDSHSMAFVRFLVGDFLAKIKEAVPQENQEQHSLAETFMRTLLHKLPSTDGKRSGTIHTPNSIVSEASYTLQPGDQLPIRNSVKLRWEWEEDEGGSISQVGGRTTLTAGDETGTFVLLGYTTDILRKRIKLKVVERIEMGITPSRSSMPPSGSKELLVTHFSGDKHDLKVNAEGENVRASLVGKKVTVVTENASVDAEITITVEDAEGNSAQSVIKIEEKVVDQGNSISIEGETYLLMFAPAIQQVLVNCTTEAGSPCMRINFRHGLLTCYPPEAILWNSIFQAHVSHVNETQDMGMTTREMALRVEQLMMDVTN